MPGTPGGGAGPALGENLAGRGVQRGEQRRGAVALVVVGRGSASAAATAGCARGPGTGTSRPRTAPPRAAAGPGTARRHRRVWPRSARRWTTWRSPPATGAAPARPPQTRHRVLADTVTRRHGPRRPVRRTTLAAPPNVSATIVSTTSAPISGFAPRPARARPTPATPCTAKRAATPAPCRPSPPPHEPRPRSPPRPRPSPTPTLGAHTDAATNPTAPLPQLLTLLNRHLQRGRNHRRHTPRP